MKQPECRREEGRWKIEECSRKKRGSNKYITY